METYKGCAWGLPAGLLAAALQCFFMYLEIGPYALDADISQMRTDWQSVSSTYSVAMAFLLVFRTQIAYSRLWDAISCLQRLRGTWVNCVSSCIAFCTADVSKTAEVEKFKQQLVRLMSLLYCSAMTSVCQQQRQYEVVDFEGLEESSLTWLATQPNQCEVVLQWIQRLITEKQAAGLFVAPAPILSRVFQDLGNGMLELNDARRIKLVPFPFPYSQIISIVLCLHMFFGVVVAGYTTQSPMAAFCYCFMSSFVFWSVNYIAIEIERPYGDDANDLPLADLTAYMNSALVNLLQREAQRPPLYQIDTTDDSAGQQRCKRREWRVTSWARRADPGSVDESVRVWSESKPSKGERRSRRSSSIFGWRGSLPDIVEEDNEDDGRSTASSYGCKSPDEGPSSVRSSRRSVSSRDSPKRKDERLVIQHREPEAPLKQVAEVEFSTVVDLRKLDDLKNKFVVGTLGTLGSADSTANFAAISLDDLQVQGIDAKASEAKKTPADNETVSLLPPGPVGVGGWNRPAPNSDAGSSAENSAGQPQRQSVRLSTTDIVIDASSDAVATM
eukprot:TRINITY_DN21467_c0_g3_i1.p1 TRINITY_DN21467_c0_g3~~TRINITY_DN21467_c0_g3_i1.p1  ORF type:complete len:558 (+),score=68.22 TRINITY_DN21467_c0_g3_i1:402-2075(+)